MARRGWRGFLALVALLAAPAAWAAPRDDARRHFLAGLEAAGKQDYAAALEHFLAAQDAYPHPATLYNIARAYTDLGQLAEAIRYYELYAEAVPEEAADIEPVVRVLQARLRQEQQPEPPPAAAGSAPTGEELARLQAIAEELEAISRRLAAAAPPGGEAPPDPPEGPAVPPDAVPAPPPELPAGDFISEAYERVVVTASRYGQRPLDSPSTISVIGEDEIRMSGATNVPDLLRRVVGVEVMSLSASQPEVSIRGFNRELSNKVLVLVDGRSVYWDILATPLWGTIPLSLDEIERIEVTRGPGSAVYGANAVTGVVNIITRRPGEGSDLLHLDLGQPGYGKLTALATGRQDRTAYRLSAGWHQTGRWSTALDASETPAVILTGEDDDTALRTLHANGRIDRAFLDKGLLSVSGGYLEGFTEFYTLGALGDYLLEDVQSGYARADLGYDTVLLRVFYNTLEASAGTWYAYSEAKRLATTLSTDVLDAELSGLADFETGAVRHRLSAGLGYRFKWVDWTYLEGDGQVSEHHYSAFLQEDAAIGRLSLVGSARLDRHPLVDLSRTISPRAAAIYRLQDTTSVRLTGGTSFRSPSFLETYIELIQPNASEVDGIFVTTTGDRDLAPERIVTAELGLRDESSPYHTADATLYVNRVSDLIDLQNFEPEISFYDPEVNGYRVGTTSFGNEPATYLGYGAELDGHLFPSDGVDIRANVHLQRVVDDAGDIDNSASPVKVNLSASWRTPWRVDVSAGFHSVSAQTWRLRSFGADGQLEITPVELEARILPYGRLALRPLPDDSLELAASVWNPAGLTAGEGAREHPKGQLVGGRLYGSAIYRF